LIFTIIVSSSQVVVGPGRHPGQAKALTTLRGVWSLHRTHLKGCYTLYLQEQKNETMVKGFPAVGTKARVSFNPAGGGTFQKQKMTHCGVCKEGSKKMRASAKVVGSSLTL
jgi:hypothetical protein